MHALRRALVPRTGAASRFVTSSVPARPRYATAAAPPSPLPPPPPKNHARRRNRPPPEAPPRSPSALLLDLARSERFSRDAELLAALDDLDRNERVRGAGEGPLLSLGARLWLQQLREGRNADRAQIAEALVRIAASNGGPALFGAVCRGGGVPRRTVGAALGVLDALAGDRDDGQDNEGEEEELVWLGGGSSGTLPFTRRLHDACAREVRGLLDRRRRGRDGSGGESDEEDENDIDAGAA